MNENISTELHELKERINRMTIQELRTLISRYEDKIKGAISKHKKTNWYALGVLLYMKQTLKAKNDKINQTVIKENYTYRKKITI